jgi:lipopolysaccharide transport system ATP-binding protein
MSSSDIAISARGLGKSYLIARDQQQHVTLAETVLHWARNPLKRLNRETFWALSDLAFDINRGEVVGIIGRNGAGKSTLLKVLSRITEPSAGEVDLFGRVGSLLEVGTGFHPELTGRENIFLNGAIIGMARGEIQRQFDAIVDFAGVEKFLDTPVKRYSSGMYVRLAFAVAAHLDTEILIIDEVLAVGDAEFQKKCLSKMSDVARVGRTVLFVSHSMNAVQQLCTRVIRLANGRLEFDSPDVRAGVMGYLNGSKREGAAAGWVNPGKKFESEDFMPLSLRLVDDDGKPVSESLSRDASVWVEIRGNMRYPNALLKIGYVLIGPDGAVVYETGFTDHEQEQWPRLATGVLRLRSRLPVELLNEGAHHLELAISIHCAKWICEPKKTAPSITFTITGPLGDSPYWRERREGAIAPLLDWTAAMESGIPGKDSLLINKPGQDAAEVSTGQKVLV